MLSNVGREVFVYLSHMLRQGFRATQTVFCQADDASSPEFVHAVQHLCAAPERSPGFTYLAAAP